MPNTPERGDQQPGSPEQRKRQQLNDKSLQEREDDDDSNDDGIEAPGIEEDDEVTPLRTEQGGETGEDEDLPDDATTQVNSNPGNFANDREKASEAGRKGGQR